MKSPAPSMADRRRVCLRAFARMGELLFGRGWKLPRWREPTWTVRTLDPQEREALQQIINEGSEHWYYTSVSPLRTDGIDPLHAASSVRVAFPRTPVAQAPGNED
jgi:hypothetical protein